MYYRKKNIVKYSDRGCSRLQCLVMSLLRSWLVLLLSFSIILISCAPESNMPPNSNMPPESNMPPNSNMPPESEADRITREAQRDCPVTLLDQGGLDLCVVQGSSVTNDTIVDKLDDNPSLKEDIEKFGVRTATADIRYGAKLYKITYNTTYTEFFGDERKIRSAAMVVVPLDKVTNRILNKNFSLIAVSHGAIFSNKEAPSNWSVTKILDDIVLEGLFGAMIGGHITVNVDYLGIGASHKSKGGALKHHSFQMLDSYAEDIISAIRSTRVFAENNERITLNNNLFLRGYAEGGVATLITQKTIESDPVLKAEFPITAVSAGAGAYDLLLTSALLLKGSDAESGTTGREANDPVRKAGDFSTPGYIPFIYFAGEQTYRWPKNYIEEVFKTWSKNYIEEVFGTENSMRGVFEKAAKKRGEIEELRSSDGEFIVPKTVTDLLKSGSSDLFKRESTPPDTSKLTEAQIRERENGIQLVDAVVREMKIAFKKNSIVGNPRDEGENKRKKWVPTAPLRLYHCINDQSVPPENTIERANDLVGNKKVYDNVYPTSFLLRGDTGTITTVTSTDTETTNAANKQYPTHSDLSKEMSAYVLDKPINDVVNQHTGCPLYALSITDWFSKFDELEGE